MEEGYAAISVLKLGKEVDYTIPSFHVVTVTLREAKLQCEEGKTVTFDGFVRSCDLLTQVTLPAIARVPRGSKGACFVEKEEFDRSIDVSSCKLYDGKVLVLWKWSWMEDEELATESDSSVHDDSSSDDCSSDSLSSNALCGEDQIPEITHSVVFKCIGVLKEHRYQETLAAVSKKLRNGGSVPVQLSKEPHNPTDARAIAFECRLDSTWERIGYIVREALEAVHEAMDKGNILAVQFDWVKYVVQFQNRDFYAGIKITRRGEWPQHVLRCRSKTVI